MKLVNYFPTVPARHAFYRNAAEAARAHNRTEQDWIPRADIVERENGFGITLELPGFEKENVKVTVENGVLAVSGERKHEESENEGVTWHRRERHYGTFERTFRLPKGVDGEKIEARFSNGLLELSVPKPVEILPKTVEIN